MARGNITKRGATSWRLKYEAGDPDPITGKRQTRYVTFRGTKKAAHAELTRRLAEVDAGTAVEPSRVTVAEYLRGWLGIGEGLAPKTLERYRQLAERQIIPHLGAISLQKLRPAQILTWHASLSATGLAARTIGHAHRVLHRGMARATSLEIVPRNVAHAVPPPKIEAKEIAILSAAEIADVLVRLHDHPLYPIAALALGTGMRRGELCGLAWGALDLDNATVRVERSL
jgi:integrase